MTSNVTIQDQLLVVAKRLVSMGVSSLRENTKCQAVANVVHQQQCLGKPKLHPHAIHSLLGDFQVLHQHEAMGKANGAPACQIYPSDPKQLGYQWLAQCYGQEVAACCTFPLAAMLKKARSKKKQLSYIVKNNYRDNIFYFVSLWFRWHAGATTRC